MSAKINHVAIVSENYAILGQFYQAVFAMKSSGHQRPGRAITVCWIPKTPSNSRLIRMDGTKGPGVPESIVIEISPSTG